VYTVIVRNSNGCEKLRTITVTGSDVAIISSIDIVDLVDNNTATIIATPTGNITTTYLYSIDLPNGPYQQSNYFEHITPGIHTAYVYDTNGCGVVSKDFAVLQIPKFFTPNGDSINDYWDIVGMNPVFYKNSTIEIFDRYGKLLSVVDPKGKGWDGNYHGRPMPSTDYWYVVRLDDGRTVKGHFSMVR
jgi:gliding motility-associated-like protein